MDNRTCIVPLRFIRRGAIMRSMNAEVRGVSKEIEHPVDNS